MAALKAIIVDDEERARRVLHSMLKQEDAEIEILAECSNVPSAVIEINKHQPDVVFLDVEMPDYSGFELYDFFKGDIDFQIVFVTAYSEYAIRAFEVSAVDYVLKPVSPDALLKALEKVKERLKADVVKSNATLRSNLATKGLEKIAVPNSTGLEIIKTSDILYIEADGAYCKFFFADKPSILISKSLKHYETQLAGLSNFFRPHRSFLVNLDALKEYNRNDGTLILDNGNSIPVSRSNRSQMDSVIEGYLLCSGKQY